MQDRFKIANEILNTIKDNPKSPELFHAIRTATKRIQTCEATADDYRLLLKYPGIAQIFLRTDRVSFERDIKENQSCQKGCTTSDKPIE